MYRRTTHLLGPLLFLALLLPVVSLATDTFTGKVVGISDGDTISVMRDGMAVKIHLHISPFVYWKTKFTMAINYRRIQGTEMCQEKSRYN